MYYFYSLLTAPGVIVHELGHYLFCKLSGMRVIRMKLFRFGNPAGYVIHEEPTKFYQSFLITFGPLLLNTTLTVWLFYHLAVPYISLVNFWPVYFGFAIALHAIPSTGDASSLLSSANHRIWRNPFVLIGYPFILILYILNLLKRLKIHFVYAFFLLWLAQII